jgi:hypothetical protein
MVGNETTIYLDEAGMVDHKRLDDLTRLAECTGAKLVAVGDGEQLPAIGPGGMFSRLTARAPSAALSDIRRTRDPGEQQAWKALRAGEPERAIAYYQAQGRLHLADTREQAAENAVQAWAKLTSRYDIREVALIADASNHELARLNARAQHLRAQRGELGAQRIEPPGYVYGLHVGDLVAFTRQHRPKAGPRVENGARGEITSIRGKSAIVTLDGSQRQVRLAGKALGALRELLERYVSLLDAVGWCERLNEHDVTLNLAHHTQALATSLQAQYEAEDNRRMNCSCADGRHAAQNMEKIARFLRAYDIPHTVPHCRPIAVGEHLERARVASSQADGYVSRAQRGRCC